VLSSRAENTDKIRILLTLGKNKIKNKASCVNRYKNALSFKFQNRRILMRAAKKIRLIVPEIC
jgi:hypothetical protein